jgi:hypothetical protein
LGQKRIITIHLGAENRRLVLQELREFVERGIPEPQEDWNVISPLSGPETGNIFDEENIGNSGYNETEKRFRTAIDIAKAVTAKRLAKPLEEITIADIRANGPFLYFNGLAEQNQFLADEGLNILENKYGFPRENIKITQNMNIRHTGHQFQDYPDGLAGNGKFVLVSDLYHLPRMSRYLGLDTVSLNPENTVLSPALPLSLNIPLTLDEIKKIYPYIEKGILPSDTIKES